MRQINSSDRSLKLVALIAGLALGGALPAHALTDPVTHQNEVGSFTSSDVQKARFYIEAAKTASLNDTIVKAGKFDPEAMLTYGLALGLGRPSTSDKLDPPTKRLLLTAFKDLIRIYMSHARLPQAGENSERLLEHAEFWILIAQRLGARAPNTQINVEDLGTVTGDSDLTQRQYVLSSDAYAFSSTPVLPRGLVMAAQSCVTDAATLTHTRKLIHMDAHQFKHITSAQFTAMQKDAGQIYRETLMAGPADCGDQTYFDSLVTFVTSNPGPLDKFREDPDTSR